MLTCSVAIHNPDPDIFRKFLISLEKYTPELHELIIIDNASENYAEWTKILNQIFDGPEVKIQIIHNPKNIGFGESHNKALKEATGTYFAVLNDDIDFFEVWSTPMIELFKSDLRIGQVCPRYGNFNTLFPSFGWKDTNEPDFAEGSCFMMRTEVAREFDLFDSVYKVAYYEDSDLSLRLRKAGFIIKTVPLDWLHYRAVTSSKTDLDIEGYHIKNEVIFKDRWTGYIFSGKFKDLIIVKRTASYGDVFLMEPILEALKEKYDCVIGVMSHSAEILQMIINSPFVDGKVPLNHPVRCNRFIDLDYAYEKDFRKHIIDAYAEVAGIEVKRKHGRVYTSEQNKNRVKKILDDKSDFISIEISDTWGAKQWPFENYKELIKLLKRDGHKVFGIGLTSHPIGDMGFDENYINIFSPMETAEFMRHSSLHIGHEGLLGHFAQALNIPHVLIYCCTSPEYVSDTSLNTWRGVISPVACQGCRHVHAAGCMVICKRDYECTKRISVEMVYEKCKELIDENILCTG